MIPCSKSNEDSVADHLPQKLSVVYTMFLQQGGTIMSSHSIYLQFREKTGLV